MSCIYATFTTQVSELLFGQEILSNNHITSIQYMFQIPSYVWYSMEKLASPRPEM